MRFMKFLAIAISLSLFIGGCSDENSDEPLVSTATFTLIDTNSKTYKVEKRGPNYSIDAGKDKVVLFDIFATWCPPCQAESKHLAQLQQKYGDKLMVIGVTIEDDLSNEDLESFKTKHAGGGDYIVVNKNDNQPLARSIASTIGVGQQFPLPLMVMYNKGEYVNHYAGATPQEILDRDIATQLGMK